MDPWLVPLSALSFLVGVTFHELAHAVARARCRVPFRIRFGMGPCIIRSRHLEVYLIPAGARTLGPTPTCVAVPLAGPICQLGYALLISHWQVWLGVLGGLGSLTLLPYRWKGHASDGLTVLQLWLKERNEW